ncbi:SDR family NAD(P)-dependent oxidoreductase [Accumulibacter sp.]|uniref:SDR family NAD(P)-dependent oxidoreductase n=1 Tax=Accumulibacter sp. TaxID=2053492 RepID=UPI0025EC09E4|nr:SDR family NAD(P)-dependent oxidoreductase [Accumulibacter sp.]MCM8594183.1 SDR family NAD(P)-dependent oxidoreductase [Accumulibacter sp.]MCM8625745.1 SDR family NAD(P)-dependent oxidoreductase [Accumulibacter sp.]MDS4048326.1 SDR family NAD(P)-dependent oxidoreductase [Accumulibacter sp.]
MNPRITDWRGLRVWVLGASSGIGAALARLLLQSGARVALSARSAPRLAEVAEDRRCALVLPCDALSEASVRAACDQLVASWDGIDVAIYVAGDYQPMRAWQIDPARARQMIGVNLGGAIAFAACVVPQLLRQGHGQIAFVASVAGYRGLPRSLVYGPTKAALINFAESLYLDLRPRGIGVRLINPGFVETPMTAGNDFTMPALLSAEQAARETVGGFATSSFEIHYPKRFTRLLKLLAVLPYRIYFALVQRVAG